MPPRRLTVIVCRGPTCGDKRDSESLYRHLDALLTQRGLRSQVSLGRESCFGQCLRGPNILVCDTDEIRGSMGQPDLTTPTAVLYNRMTTADVERVVDKHLVGGIVVRLLTNRAPIKDEE